MKSINTDLKMFQVRAIVVFVIIMLAIAVCCMQIFTINISQINTAAGINSSKTLVLGESRGLIYDTNMRRLVCNDYSYVSALKPSFNALSGIRNQITEREYNRAFESIVSRFPVLLYTGNKINSDDVICEKLYKRYNDYQLAAHIIGYTDSTGRNGISGVEYAFNDYLQQKSGSYKVRFFTDGKGDVMIGGDVEVINSNYNSSAGVVMTIDKSCQNALENAMNKCGLKKGAAVMVEIETGAVVASVSRPAFNPNSVADYINDSDSVLFNRAFGAYPVGSVFKTLVAASAIEQGFDPEQEMICNGRISLGSIEFSCTKSHGKINMSSALAYSCNCYFVNLIDKIDCSQVVDLAASLGFGNAVDLDESISTYSGYLPENTELNSAAARAIFSFGQGKLTANPFQIAMLYSMVANKGQFRKPYLIKGFCDNNGEMQLSYKPKAPVRLISDGTAELLSTMLELAVKEGTGQAASVDGMNVAGKTATAQSGEYINGKERLVTWFAGFFPYENPEYVAVIVCEDGSSGSKDCAPVFSELARMCQSLIIN